MGVQDLTHLEGHIGYYFDQPDRLKLQATGGLSGGGLT